MKFAGYLCAWGLVAACTGGSPELSDTEQSHGDVPSWDAFRENPPVGWDEFRASAARESFAPYRFIVDGDIRLAGEPELQDFYQKWLAQEYASIAPGGSALTAKNVLGADVLWPISKRFDLTYCVSNSFGTRKADVVAAMDRATRSWSGSVAVQFSYRPDQDATCSNTNNNVVFDVRPVNESYFAASFFPDDPRPARELLITNAAFTTTDGGRDFEGILRHETGHILGFRHEHIWIGCGGEGTADARHVTSYDVNSVMHYPQCRPSRTGGYRQSQLDIVGAAMLYTDRGEPVPADYDNDGLIDLAVKTNVLGLWKIDYAKNGFGSWDLITTGWGTAEFHAVPADYDGDGKLDLAVKSDVNGGVWSIDYARDGFTGTNDVIGGWGGPDFHAVPADYDGDGKADLAVKSDLNGGVWSIDYARDGFTGTNDVIGGWGGADFHAVPADYDGDLKADLAVKSDINGGVWSIDYAKNGFTGANDLLGGWGGASFHAVPADYDGDGKLDLAVKSDVNGGEWSIDYAKDGFTGVHFGDTLGGWGGASFIAVPRDYDHDGIADLAVFRTDNESWQIDYAKDGFHGVNAIFQPH
jgi:hypothetical protein